MNDGGDCRTAPATPGLLNMDFFCSSVRSVGGRVSESAGTRKQRSEAERIL